MKICLFGNSGISKISNFSISEGGRPLDCTLRISAMDVKYSLSLAATFSEFVTVSSFIINSSGRALDDAILFCLT